MSDNYICPQCKGRRVVFDPMSLFLTIGLPFALLVESDDDEGITKKECPTCRGKGKI
jgi:rubredoxin